MNPKVSQFRLLYKLCGALLVHSLMGASIAQAGIQSASYPSNKVRGFVANVESTRALIDDGLSAVVLSLAGLNPAVSKQIERAQTEKRWIELTIPKEAVVNVEQSAIRKAGDSK